MIKIKKLHVNAVLPHYATDGASAFDLFCYEDVKWENTSGKHYAIVPTGWAFEVPTEHGMFILSRSGHGRKHLIHLANCVGLLDFDYRGEAIVILMCHLDAPPIIKSGTAVAQACIIETPRQYFEIVDELSETERGASGLGSTGM